MTNHTPGPWYIEQFAHPYGKTEDRTITGYTRTGNPLRIGRAYNVMGPSETDANARLIAAAPETTEALSDAIDALCEVLAILDGSSHTVDIREFIVRTLEKAKIARNKATGAVIREL